MMFMAEEKKDFWAYQVKIGQSNYIIDMKYKVIIDNYKIIFAGIFLVPGYR